MHEWIGRLISILFFAASLPFVFLIIRRGFGGEAAKFGVVLYSFAPLMVAASRAFIPDMASLGCAMAGFYFFSGWIDDQPVALRPRMNRQFTLSALLLALSLLLKPTTGIIFAAMLALALKKFGGKVGGGSSPHFSLSSSRATATDTNGIA